MPTAVYLTMTGNWDEAMKEIDLAIQLAPTAPPETIRCGPCTG